MMDKAIVSAISLAFLLILSLSILSMMLAFVEKNDFDQVCRNTLYDMDLDGGLTEVKRQELEDSLEHSTQEPELFGGPRNYSFALLLALSLNHVRTLTEHWWHQDPFTFQHAKGAAEIVLEYCKPPG